MASKDERNSDRPKVKATISRRSIFDFSSVEDLRDADDGQDSTPVFSNKRRASSDSSPFQDSYIAHAPKRHSLSLAQRYGFGSKTKTFSSMRGSMENLREYGGEREKLGNLRLSKLSKSTPDLSVRYFHTKEEYSSTRQDVRKENEREKKERDNSVTKEEQGKEVPKYEVTDERAEFPRRNIEMPASLEEGYQERKVHHLQTQTQLQTKRHKQQNVPVEFTAKTLRRSLDDSVKSTSETPRGLERRPQESSHEIEAQVDTADNKQDKVKIIEKEREQNVSVATSSYETAQTTVLYSKEAESEVTERVWGASGHTSETYLETFQEDISSFEPAQLLKVDSGMRHTPHDMRSHKQQVSDHTSDVQQTLMESGENISESLKSLVQNFSDMETEIFSESRSDLEAGHVLLQEQTQITLETETQSVNSKFVKEQIVSRNNHSSMRQEEQDLSKNGAGILANEYQRNASMSVPREESGDPGISEINTCKVPNIPFSALQDTRSSDNVQFQENVKSEKASELYGPGNHKTDNFQEIVSNENDSSTNASVVSNSEKYRPKTFTVSSLGNYKPRSFSDIKNPGNFKSRPFQRSSSYERAKSKTFSEIANPGNFKAKTFSEISFHGTMRSVQTGNVVSVANDQQDETVGQECQHTESKQTSDDADLGDESQLGDRRRDKTQATSYSGIAMDGAASKVQVQNLVRQTDFIKSDQQETSWAENILEVNPRLQSFVEKETTFKQDEMELRKNEKQMRRQEETKIENYPRGTHQEPQEVRSTTLETTAVIDETSPTMMSDSITNVSSKMEEATERQGRQEAPETSVALQDGHSSTIRGQTMVRETNGLKANLKEALSGENISDLNPRKIDEIQISGPEDSKIDDDIQCTKLRPLKVQEPADPDTTHTDDSCPTRSSTCAIGESNKISVEKKSDFHGKHREKLSEVRLVERESSLDKSRIQTIESAESVSLRVSCEAITDTALYVGKEALNQRDESSRSKTVPMECINSEDVSRVSNDRDGSQIIAFEQALFDRELGSADVHQVSSNTAGRQVNLRLEESGCDQTRSSEHGREDIADMAGQEDIRAPPKSPTTTSKPTRTCWKKHTEPSITQEDSDEKKEEPSSSLMKNMMEMFCMLGLKDSPEGGFYNNGHERPVARRTMGEDIESVRHRIDTVFESKIVGETSSPDDETPEIQEEIPKESKRNGNEIVQRKEEKREARNYKAKNEAKEWFASGKEETISQKLNDENMESKNPQSSDTCSEILDNISGLRGEFESNSATPDRTVNDAVVTSCAQVEVESLLPQEPSSPLTSPPSTPPLSSASAIFLPPPTSLLPPSPPSPPPSSASPPLPPLPQSQSSSTALPQTPSLTPPLTPSSPPLSLQSESKSAPSLPSTSSLKSQSSSPSASPESLSSSPSKLPSPLPSPQQSPLSPSLSSSPSPPPSPLLPPASPPASPLSQPLLPSPPLPQSLLPPPSSPAPQLQSPPPLQSSIPPPSSLQWPPPPLPLSEPLPLWPSQPPSSPPPPSPSSSPPPLSSQTPPPSPVPQSQSPSPPPSTSSPPPPPLLSSQAPLPSPPRSPSAVTQIVTKAETMLKNLNDRENCLDLQTRSETDTNKNIRMPESVQDRDDPTQQNLSDFKESQLQISEYAIEYDKIGTSSEKTEVVEEERQSKWLNPAIDHTKFDEENKNLDPQQQQYENETLFDSLKTKVQISTRDVQIYEGNTEDFDIATAFLSCKDFSLELERETTADENDDEDTHEELASFPEEIVSDSSVVLISSRDIDDTRVTEEKDLQHKVVFRSTLEIRINKWSQVFIMLSRTTRSKVSNQEHCSEVSQELSDNGSIEKTYVEYVHFITIHVVILEPVRDCLLQLRDIVLSPIRLPAAMTKEVSPQHEKSQDITRQHEAESLVNITDVEEFGKLNSDKDSAISKAGLDIASEENLEPIPEENESDLWSTDSKYPEDDNMLVCVEEGGVFRPSSNIEEEQLEHRNSVEEGEGEIVSERTEEIEDDSKLDDIRNRAVDSRNSDFVEYEQLQTISTANDECEVVGSRSGVTLDKTETVFVKSLLTESVKKTVTFQTDSQEGFSDNAELQTPPDAKKLDASPVSDKMRRYTDEDPQEVSELDELLTTYQEKRKSLLVQQEYFSQAELQNQESLISDYDDDDDDDDDDDNDNNDDNDDNDDDDDDDDDDKDDNAFPSPPESSDIPKGNFKEQVNSEYLQRIPQNVKQESWRGRKDLFAIGEQKATSVVEYITTVDNTETFGQSRSLLAVLQDPDDQPRAENSLEYKTVKNKKDRHECPQEAWDHCQEETVTFTNHSERSPVLESAATETETEDDQQECLAGTEKWSCEYFRYVIQDERGMRYAEQDSPLVVEFTGKAEVSEQVKPVSEDSGISVEPVKQVVYRTTMDIYPRQNHVTTCYVLFQRYGMQETPHTDFELVYDTNEWSVGDKAVLQGEQKAGACVVYYGSVGQAEGSENSETEGDDEAEDTLTEIKLSFSERKRKAVEPTVVTQTTQITVEDGSITQRACPVLYSDEEGVDLLVWSVPRKREILNKEDISHGRGKSEELTCQSSPRTSLSEIHSITPITNPQSLISATSPAPRSRTPPTPPSTHLPTGPLPTASPTSSPTHLPTPLSKISPTPQPTPTQNGTCTAAIIFHHDQTRSSSPTPCFISPQISPLQSPLPQQFILSPNENMLHVNEEDIIVRRKTSEAQVLWSPQPSPLSPVLSEDILSCSSSPQLSLMSSRTNQTKEYVVTDEIPVKNSPEVSLLPLSAEHSPQTSSLPRQSSLPQQSNEEQKYRVSTTDPEEMRLHLPPRPSSPQISLIFPVTHPSNPDTMRKRELGDAETLSPTVSPMPPASDDAPCSSLPKLSLMIPEARHYTTTQTEPEILALESPELSPPHDASPRRSPLPQQSSVSPPTSPQPRQQLWSYPKQSSQCDGENRTYFKVIDRRRKHFESSMVLYRGERVKVSRRVRAFKNSSSFVRWRLPVNKRRTEDAIAEEPPYEEFLPRTENEYNQDSHGLQDRTEQSITTRVVNMMASPEGLTFEEPIRDCSWQLDVEGSIGEFNFSENHLDAAALENDNTVLGNEGFSFGRHSWTIKASGFFCAVGVCHAGKEDAAGSWYKGRKWVWTTDGLQYSSSGLQRSDFGLWRDNDVLEVCLDCEVNAVTILNRNTSKQATLTGFTGLVYPYFNLYRGSSLSLLETFDA